MRGFFRPSRGLQARVRRVASLTKPELDAMWTLFQSAYAGATRDAFERDLAEKHHVIVLKDAQSGLQGFSTLLKLDVEGAEEPLLEDCRDALGGVRALALEIHDFDPRHRRTPRVLELLTEAGYEIRLDELHPLGERAPAPADDDMFPSWPAAWVLGVRAVRRG